MLADVEGAVALVDGLVCTHLGDEFFERVDGVGLVVVVVVRSAHQHTLVASNEVAGFVVAVGNAQHEGDVVPGGCEFENLERPECSFGEEGLASSTMLDGVGLVGGEAVMLVEPGIFGSKSVLDEVHGIPGGPSGVVYGVGNLSEEVLNLGVLLGRVEPFGLGGGEPEADEFVEDCLAHGAFSVWVVMPGGDRRLADGARAGRAGYLERQRIRGTNF